MPLTLQQLDAQPEWIDLTGEKRRKVVMQIDHFVDAVLLVPSAAGPSASSSSASAPVVKTEAPPTDGVAHGASADCVPSDINDRLDTLSEEVLLIVLRKLSAVDLARLAVSKAAYSLPRYDSSRVFDQLVDRLLGELAAVGCRDEIASLKFAAATPKGKLPASACATRGSAICYAQVQLCCARHGVQRHGRAEQKCRVIVSEAPKFIAYGSPRRSWDRSGSDGETLCSDRPVAAASRYRNWS
jgi:hypothetical protein